MTEHTLNLSSFDVLSPWAQSTSRLRPDHVDVYDEVVLLSDYTALREAFKDFAQAVLDPENQPSQYGTTLVELAHRSSQSSLWVAVSERLPDPGIPVLVYCKNSHGKGRRLRAEWCPRWTVESVCDDDSDNYEYSEEKDQYYVNEGWYETNEFEETHWKIDRPVTHWMPLPEPPEADNTLTRSGSGDERG